MKSFSVAIVASILHASALATPQQTTVSMTYCQDVDSSFEKSAFNSLPVLQGVFSHFGYRLSKTGPDFNAPKAEREAIRSSEVTIVKPPRHGAVERLSPQSDFWQYAPTSGYTGEDSVTFLVIAKGQRFNITANLLVHEVVDEYASPRNCEKHFSRM